MQVTEVTYEANKNLGNYETERVRMTAVVNENENAEAVLDKLQGTVLKWLGLDVEPAGSEVKKPHV